MKFGLISAGLSSILSIAAASRHHGSSHHNHDRISLERVSRSVGSDSTRQQVQRTLARYSLQSGRLESGTTQTHSRSRLRQHQRGRRIMENVRLEGHTEDRSWNRGDVFEAADRRSKQIDASRVPVEHNPSETAFVGQVGIGTPNQYFNLEFDIASADTWVRVTNANCSHNTKCPKDLRAFVPEESISFDKSPNVTWNLDFSNGIQVNGTLSTDAIQVAGFVAERQTIGLADSFQGFKKDDGIDGSFGLGLMELTFHGDRTPIENFIRAGSMRSEVGVWLGRGNQGGELIFGGRDRGRYYGDINYYNLPRDSVYWAIPVESITVVSNQLNDDGSNQRTFRSDTITSKVGNSTVPPNVIFDTSTNIIMLPPNIALQVHRHIHNYFFGFYSGYSLVFGHYTVPCSLGDMETDIWIDLGPSVPKASVPTPIPTPTPKPTNHSTLVPPAGLPSPLPRSLPSPQPRAKGQDENVTGASQNMRFRISGSDLVRERLPVFGGLIDVCYSGIQASKSESDDWVFGNIWFMNNYMTFDHHHRQIGVAPAVQS